MTSAIATEETLARELRTLGVRPGALLLVHTSFRAVAPVEGGPLGLVRAGDGLRRVRRGPRERRARTRAGRRGNHALTERRAARILAADDEVMNEQAFQFFLRFHEGIPRKGPGTAAATAEAFHRIAPLLPPSPAVLDVGCGGGAQTLTLAGLGAGTILAVDRHPPFIEELRERIAALGLESRVTAQVGDMKALGLAPGTFDLIWSEGALFVLGFENGLRTLRPLLRGPGVVVVTEAAWLAPRREIPADVLAFWDEPYPAMTDVAGNLALARRAGYAVLDHFSLPAEGWAAYVDPLERRMNEVLAEHRGDPHAEEAAESERREFAMFRQNLRYFGYEFFLLRRA